MATYVHINMSNGGKHTLKCNKDKFLDELYSNEDYIITEDEIYINKIQVTDIQFEHKLFDW